MPNYLKGIIKNRFGPVLLPLTLLNETVHSTQVYYFDNTVTYLPLVTWIMVVVFFVERRREFLSFNYRQQLEPLEPVDVTGQGTIGNKRKVKETGTVSCINTLLTGLLELLALFGVPHVPPFLMWTDYQLALLVWKQGLMPQLEQVDIA